MTKKEEFERMIVENVEDHWYKKRSLDPVASQIDSLQKTIWQFIETSLKEERKKAIKGCIDMLQEQYSKSELRKASYQNNKQLNYALEEINGMQALLTLKSNFLGLLTQKLGEGNES